jgi:simple sugar transport system ATP-binding protein
MYVIAKGRLSPSVATADASREQIGLWMSGLWEDQATAKQEAEHV